VNNAGLPDRVAVNEDFREMIEFAISNAKDLQNFKHMGKMKYASIRLGTYHDFVKSVTALVLKIREWYKKNTVSCIPNYFTIHS
jgi:hypothetical protein